MQKLATSVMNAVTPDQTVAMFDVQQRLDDYIDVLVAHVEELWDRIREDNATRDSIDPAQAKEAREIDSLLAWHKRDRDDEETCNLFTQVVNRMHNLTAARLDTLLSEREIDADRACRYVRELARYRSENNKTNELRRAIWDANTGER